MSFSLPSANRPEIPALTSLRFFAALWVALFHIREIGLWRGGGAAYSAVARLGYLGVSFFFVLSGFILVYVYAGRNVTKSRFWQARFARIYPAYAFSLLVTLPAVIYGLPYMKKMHLTALVLTSFPLLFEAWVPRVLFFWNTPAWSLSVEVIFYLLFPFIVLRLQKFNPRALFLWITGAWLASLIITITYVLLRPDGVAHTTTQSNDLDWLSVVKFNPIARLPEFLLGMGVGAIFLRMHARARSWLIIAGALFVLLGIALQDWIPYPIMHTGLLAPAFALLILGFATQPAWTRFLAAKPLILLGEASYSFYLLHVMPIAIMTFVRHLDRSPHIHAIIATYLILMCVVSILVFLLLENPLRRLLGPRKRTQPQTAVVT
jgi:peptidoglycan/LPS O-acetylase OafA/YrhL